MPDAKTQYDIGVAVLAGGASSRMGTNKALLNAYPGGPTIIEAVALRLRDAGLEPDLLVTNTPETFAFLGILTLPDDIPGVGPLGGIYTALNHLPHPRTLVVACDMPLLNPGLLRYIVTLPTDADVLVPCWTDAGGEERIEMLHAIYSRRCIESILKRIEAGKLRVQALLGDLKVQYLDEAEMRRYDPGLDSFRNINTPEEWEWLRSRC